MKNPDWTRDELILALDLYMRAGRRQLKAQDSRVVELSQLLQLLPIHPFAVRSPQFRNPQGVSMKLGNFSALDPRHDGTGLQQGGKGDREVWDYFFNRGHELAEIATTIRKSVELSFTEVAYDNPDDFAYEGTIVLRLHKARERNTSLIMKKKAQALKSTGKLACEVCGFDFEKVYGSIGIGFIECHHLIPLESIIVEHVTRLSDLALVCANCHRMLHSRNPVLTLGELREVLSST
jgi:5-methylcytosine-specific restriction enzyme A